MNIGRTEDVLRRTYPLLILITPIIRLFLDLGFRLGGAPERHLTYRWLRASCLIVEVCYVTRTHRESQLFCFVSIPCQEFYCRGIFFIIFCYLSHSVGFPARPCVYARFRGGWGSRTSYFLCRCVLCFCTFELNLYVVAVWRFYRNWLPEVGVLCAVQRTAWL